MSLPLLYSVEREFASPVATVWDAWIDAAKLESWYFPVGLSALPGSTVSDARVGGAWAVTVDVPEFSSVAYFFGEYTEVRQYQRLSHTMLYTESAAEFAVRDLTGPHHDVIIDFESRGDCTWVRFAQYGELPEGHAARAQAGMESYFDSLQAFLEDSTSGSAA